MEMKLKSIDNKELKNLPLPIQFQEEIREDLIKKIFIAYMDNNRQAYGAKPDAGQRYSAKLSRRRRNYRGGYGKGISRVPRKILVRRGMQMYWVGAYAPGTVGGRRAHAPKAEKIWSQKINTKERKKALRSAVSATIDVDCITKNGYKVPENFQPFLVENQIESVIKTKDLINILMGYGFSEELTRAQIKTIRSGKGKNRGRKYKKKKSLLIVVGNKEANLLKVSNIPGVEIANVNNLNIKYLSPNGKPGRLTFWTENAINKMNDEKLFL